METKLTPNKALLLAVEKQTQRNRDIINAYALAELRLRAFAKHNRKYEILPLPGKTMEQCCSRIDGVYQLRYRIKADELDHVLCL